MRLSTALAALLLLALAACAASQHTYAPYSCTTAACVQGQDTADTVDETSGGN